MKKYLLPSALILALGLGYALAQNITKAIQLSQDATGAFGVDSSNNVYFPAHVLSTGPTPAVSSNLTSVTGTDFQGTITETANSAGGTITFNKAYLAAPNCVLVAQTAASASPLTYTTVTTNLTYSHLSQVSGKFNYICSGAS